MNIKIIVNDRLMPTKGSEQSAGVDLRADIRKNVTIQPGTRLLVKTGVKIALPDGYEAQIRPRSGLALKHGITVLNTPGTVDADYRDEIGVILYNSSDKEYTIYPEERIAQMVIAKFEKAIFNQVNDFSEKEMEVDRGGGFGHTGKQDLKEPVKKVRKAKKQIKNVKKEKE